MKDKTKAKDDGKKKDEVILEETKLDSAATPENFEDRYKRALADYDNLLKQSAKEKQEFAKYAAEQLLYNILPVYDNLKMAMKHADGESEKSPWVVGVGHVIKQFADALAEQGVEEIKTVGEIFDHNSMEAMAGNGEKVVKELRSGYKLHGKVIVPAKVELESIKN